MLLTEDIQLLYEADLSPNEWQYLRMLEAGLFEEEPETPEEGVLYRTELWHRSHWEVSLELLEDRGYLEKRDGVYKVTKAFVRLFRTDEDSMWYELCGKYPHKVPNGSGGFRTLHTLEPDAKSNAALKKKYLKIVHNKPKLHENIMRLLDIQIQQQRGKLQFLPHLKTWLNQRKWEEWSHLLPMWTPSTNPSEGKKYGQEVQ